MGGSWGQIEEEAGDDWTAEKAEMQRRKASRERDQAMSWYPIAFLGGGVLLRPFPFLKFLLYDSIQFRSVESSGACDLFVFLFWSSQARQYLYLYSHLCRYLRQGKESGRVKKNK